MLVVTLPLSAAKDPRSFTKKAKVAGAQMLEIRGDITPKVRPFISPLPLLLSPRGTSLSLPSSFLDIDISDVHTVVSKKTKCIRSYHDYSKTPTLRRLKTIVERARKERPWAVKIATTVRSEKDLLILSALQAWLKKQNIRSIVLGMGPLAHLTRVLSPLRNALTYAVLDGYSASADGQLPLSFYRQLARRKNPAIFGIIGGPHVTSSLSPLIHNALFQRHKVDAVYSCFPSTNLRRSIDVLTQIGVKGYSVTAPFKRDAFTLAQRQENLVQELGIANTLIRSGNKFSAFLTDAYGIECGYPFLRTASSVAILGSGGAVPSVIHAVRTLNENAMITVFTRDPKKAAAILRDTSVNILPLAAAEGFVADVVLCAVSEDITVPMPAAGIAIDLRYGKVTQFLEQARNHKMKTFDGVPMLIHQALKQFRHFTRKAPKKDDAEYLSKVLQDFLPTSH